MEARMLDQLAAFAAELPPIMIEEIAQVLRDSQTVDRLAICRRLQPAARVMFDRLCELLAEQNACERPRELAAALQAAAYQAGRMRADGAVELVWTGPTFTTKAIRNTEQAIHEVIMAAKKSLDIVVFAAYKVPLLTRAIADAVGRGVRVRLVLENRDESAGKVTFDAAQSLSGSAGDDIEVYVWPLDRRLRNERGQYGTLHAKFVVADCQLLFVSSANLTEFAMNLNIEMGVLIRGGAEPGRAVAMLDDLIQRGTLARLDK